MPILGKNLGVGSQLKQKALQGKATEAANGSQAVTSGLMHFALRTDVQVGEIGVTIVGGSGGTNATIAAAGAGNALIAFYYQKAGSNPVKFASATIAGGSSVGSEFTSRDGTISFVAAYDHPSKRIFSKGTRIGVEFDNGGGGAGNTGSASDFFSCWISAPEYGAPPA